jgi:hypothetical protein
MIEFFETKGFNAATVGALTMMVGRFADLSSSHSIGLAPLVATAFLVIFNKIEVHKANRTATKMASARRRIPNGTAPSWAGRLRKCPIGWAGWSLARARPGHFPLITARR